MRLLNVHTLELHEFVVTEFAGGSEFPEYAILSHTWADEEVNYADFNKENSLHKKGYSKILSFCELAASRGIEYAWIDTCCVDKRSSAELSETINSIFLWYSQAAECYAYLSDVTTTYQNKDLWKQQFAQSRWFTRGWTLPELLAPKTVIFVDCCWQIVGFKASSTRPTLACHLPLRYQHNLNSNIEAITGIPRSFLEGESLSNASVDDKINWARNRKTSRIEDMAYCLLGILGLSMDLRYGEGTRAFVRLRDEIIRWENEDLPVPVSSGFEALEILKMPRRRKRRNLTQESQSAYARPEIASKAKNDMQPTTPASHSTIDPGSSSQAPASSASPRAADSMPIKAKKRLSISTCWIIIILGGMMISGSFAVGLFYSIAKNQMGDGFTVAGWIIAVGTLALAVPMTQHYPRCKCWKKAAESILGSA